jgi:ribonuclease T2
MKPLYERTEQDRGNTCFQPIESKNPYTSEYCLASVRNTPYDIKSGNNNPAFVVWPTNSSQVQVAVKFAMKHNLCVMVAGTGHDFIGRHSCSDAIFIRTSLLKSIKVDLKDERGFSHSDGNFEFGAGLVFAEAHKTAADNNRFISSGWASTVGVIGWALGGGHGPFAPSKGMGVDNILEAEIVTPNGELLRVNKTSNSDLFWAIRGGGGSNWGIFTSITVRAHLIPAGGFTLWTAIWKGSVCNQA